MADLEDSFFKQNVPGRWSSHEPKDDIRPGETGEINELNDDDVDELPPKTEDEALFEQARALSNADVPEPIRRSILAERMKKSKTGVKGVLADYKAAKEMERAQERVNADHRHAVLMRIAGGYKMNPSEALLLQQQENNIVMNFNSVSNTVDNAEDDDDEDDEFMKEFREKRLKEMMSQSAKPLFGYCKDVDTQDFVDEVDKEDPRTAVVVHLYEPSVQHCVRLNRFLDELSRSMKHVKFLRMKASSNEIEVDIVALPILNIYRGGELITVLAGIATDLGAFFTKDDIEWLLESTFQNDNIK
jgi:hypothetical protein